MSGVTNLLQTDWPEKRIRELLDDAAAKENRLSRNEKLFCQEQRQRLKNGVVSLTDRQRRCLLIIERKVYVV